LKVNIRGQIYKTLCTLVTTKKKNSIFSIHLHFNAIKLLSFILCESYVSFHRQMFLLFYFFFSIKLYNKWQRLSAQRNKYKYMREWVEIDVTCNSTKVFFFLLLYRVSNSEWIKVYYYYLVNILMKCLTSSTQSTQKGELIKIQKLFMFPLISSTIKLGFLGFYNQTITFHIKSQFHNTGPTLNLSVFKPQSLIFLTNQYYNL
jgi:hypothetical protein